jgi:ATP synthase I chain.
MIDRINARYLKVISRCGIIAAIPVLFIDKTVAVGILVGCMSVSIGQLLLTYQMTMIVDSKKRSTLGFIIGFVARMVLLLLSLLVGVLYPKVCNVWGVFISIVVAKGIFYFISATTKEGGLENGN